jgi:branched-chain amino acid transport system substrate-binding protein
MWIFSVPQAVPMMVSAVVDHMAAKGVKKVGYVGFTDSWGDQNYSALVQLAAAKGITVSTNERYNRVDTSVGEFSACCARRAADRAARFIFGGLCLGA